MENKKLNKRLVYCMILGIVLILLGVIIFIATDQNNKNMIDKQNTEIILTKYSVFEENAKLYNEKKGTFEDKVLGISVLTDIDLYHEEFVNYLNDYISSMDKIDEDAAELKDLCINHTYKDKQAISDCASFVLTYETAYNILVNEIKDYNTLMTNYNETYPNTSKSLYEEKYQTYLDFNGDGSYKGK